jgi:hypothetical protein
MQPEQNPSIPQTPLEHPTIQPNEQTTTQPSQAQPTIPAQPKQPLPSQPALVVQQPATPQVALVEPVVVKPTAPQPTQLPQPTTPPQEPSTFYQNATVTTPQPSPQVFAGGGGLVEPPKPKRNKLPFIIAGSSAAVLLLVVGGILGFYLPNTEANVYTTGLNRSGKAFDAIMTDTTDADKIESYKTTKLKGKLSAEFQDGTYAGDMDIAFDKKYSNGSANFSLKNTTEGTSQTQALSGQFMTEIPDGSTFPDIYFKLTGLSAFGLDTWIPGYADYENKWILADSKYLESLGSEYMTGQTQDEKQPTAAEIAELARVSSKATTDYVLTADEQKAVFAKKEFVGKERIDQLNTYHYKVTINKDHAIDYCEALSKAIIGSAVYKKLGGNDDKIIQTSKDAARKTCEDEVNNSDFAKGTIYDMWIDAKYKLIHKFRIYDTKDKGTYVDIGQTYKGSDELSLFVALHDTKGNSDGRFVMQTNLKTNKTSGELTYESRSVDFPVKVKLTLEAVMAGNPVTIQKPENPINIQEVMKKLGYDPAQEQADSNARNNASILAASYSEYLSNHMGNPPTGGKISGSTITLTGANGTMSEDRLIGNLSGIVGPEATMPSVVNTFNIRPGAVCNDAGTDFVTGSTRSAVVLYRSTDGPKCLDA